MKEYITIKKVGPLENINNLCIKPFTFIIGESASGKSTFMKIVCLMRYLYKMMNIRSYLKHSKITNSPFRLRFDKMMKDSGMYSMLTSESFIEYRVQMEDDIQYVIQMKNKKLAHLPIIASDHLLFNKVSFISEHRNLIPNWTQRASQNSGATLGFYFHETNNDFILASEENKEVPLDYLDMDLQITHPKGKPTRYVITPRDQRHLPIELREASSGIQTSVSIALIVKNYATEFSFKEAFKRSVLTYLYDMERLKKFEAVKEPSVLRKKVYLHIEEPELSLFPDSQCRLVDEMIYAATHASEDRELSLMFATHSPYILNYLNVVLNQTKDQRASIKGEDMSVFRIYEGEIQDLLVKDDKGRWIVDSYDLSEMMNKIFLEFDSL